MGKPMAQLDGSAVINMVWCSDYARETDTLKDPAGRSVGIGDTYNNGKWFRDDVELLTPIEEANRQIAQLQEQLDGAYTQEALEAAYTEGVNSL